jgi:DNA polymerase-3 subunit alpha
MIDEFIARKSGKKKVAYDLPELEEILSETSGVILYQEQVMQIANRLAGFSLGEADILRRAMGKKKHEEMQAQREKFQAGCAARKVNAKKAQRIFDLMAEFAGYGFNKSHSCAYALVAYQTAYLKTHYPVEFIAAMLTAETGNTDKVVKYIAEARQMGIKVLPPDVHQSSLHFTPVGEDVRFGLAAIKNVGENTANGICEARKKHGRFADVFEFCGAIDSGLVNRRVLESLVKSGALDSIPGGRAAHWANLDEALKHSQRLHRERTSGQNAFFTTMNVATPAPEHHVSNVPEWTEEERLSGEYAMLGFYISGHPLDKYAGRLKELKAVEIGSVESQRNGSDIVVAGIIVQARPMRSKKGQRWAIVSLQDQTGAIEALVFPEAFQRLEPVLKAAVPLLIKGKVNVEEVGTRLSVSDARPIEQMLSRPPALLRVRVDLTSADQSLLEHLDEIIASHPGRCKVEFNLLSGDGSEATLQSARSVQPDAELVSRLRDICGADAVVMQ